LPLPVAIWDEPAAFVGGEGFLEVTDGFDLGGPKITLRHLIGGREVGEACVELGFGLDPFEQSLGLVEGEDVATGW
jgi:hypothetical protein